MGRAPSGFAVMWLRQYMASERFLSGQGTPPWDEYKKAKDEEIRKRITKVSSESEMAFCRDVLSWRSTNRVIFLTWVGIFLALISSVTAIYGVTRSESIRCMVEIPESISK